MGADLSVLVAEALTIPQLTRHTRQPMTLISVLPSDYTQLPPLISEPRCQNVEMGLYWSAGRKSREFANGSRYCRLQSLHVPGFGVAEKNLIAADDRGVSLPTFLECFEPWLLASTS